jgi:outer membrane protein assembly factor BamB
LSMVTTTVKFSAGATPSISAASDTNSGILWAIAGAGQATGPPYAILYAFDALNLDATKHLKRLWNSAGCPVSNRDRPGYATKFTTPTIANGRVYIGTQDSSDPTNTRGELDIYGLNPTETCN